MLISDCKNTMRGKGWQSLFMGIYREKKVIGDWVEWLNGYKVRRVERVGNVAVVKRVVRVRGLNVEL